MVVSASSAASLELTATSRLAPAIFVSVDAVMPAHGSVPTPPVKGLSVMHRRHVTKLCSVPDDLDTFSTPSVATRA